MLGIVIGVAAVIAMVSIGEGAKQAVQITDRHHGYERHYDLAGFHNGRWRAGGQGSAAHDRHGCTGA